MTAIQSVTGRLKIVIISLQIDLNVGAMVVLEVSIRFEASIPFYFYFFCFFVNVFFKVHLNDKGRS